MFSERIVDVLDHFRHRYELIIINSPPLVPLVDGRALAELADRIILALAWDQTPGEVLSHAMDLLSPVSDRIMGTVLTRVDLSRLRFYDYYRSSAYLKPYGAAGLHCRGRRGENAPTVARTGRRAVRGCVVIPPAPPAPRPSVPMRRAASCMPTRSSNGSSTGLMLLAVIATFTLCPRRC